MSSECRLTRHVRGGGEFANDLRGGAYVAFLRSPHAFAKIISINIDTACQLPGVIGILTGQDILDLELGSISQPLPMRGRDGNEQHVPYRPCLASDCVVHIGEPIAIVIAKSLAKALDAVEAIEIEFEELPSVIHAEQALMADAPQIWPQAPHNVALDWSAGSIDTPISTDTNKISLRLINQRIAVASMEPRGALASYNVDTGQYYLCAGSQGTGHLRRQVANCLKIPSEKLHVESKDVGGAFGMKTPVYPEYVSMLIAAQKFGVPVRWISTRLEAFETDMQARDTVMDISLELDSKGIFKALNITGVANMGAYLASTGAAMPTTNLARCLPTCYAIETINVSLKCVFTNTVPIGPYRGAGRPEANYALERVIDKAADTLGFDRAELRRRNFIRKDQIPYSTPFGMTFDSGDFHAVISKALRDIDYDNFSKRKKDAALNNKRRGLGIACFLEHAGGAGKEGIQFQFHPDGSLDVHIDAQESGQNHAEVFKNILAEMTLLPKETITIRSGDSHRIIEGTPTIGSRSAMNVGTAIHEAVSIINGKAKEFLSVNYDCPLAQIHIKNGIFFIQGTNYKFTLSDIVGLIVVANGNADTLNTTHTISITHSFPNGCHAAEVEIDQETGVTSIISYVAIDDCGTILDKDIVTAQIQGGIAQGLGQVLGEQILYDAKGQLITGSFMDYSMPRANDIPMIRTDDAATLCTTNPLGIKGVGEAGTTGAICALSLAIINALPEDIRHDFQMPATPETIWQTLKASNLN